MQQYITAGRRRLRVDVEGDGPPLLLLMGIGGNSEMWAPLRPHLEGRQLIGVDMPGTGGSSSSRPPLRMREYASLAAAVLRDLEIEAADVLGLSWGGVLAQTLAIHHPDLVHRMVLVSTAFGLGSLAGRPAALARMTTPHRYRSRRYFEQIAPTLYGGRTARDPALLGRHAATMVKAPPSREAYTAQLLAFVGTSTLPMAPRIRCRTLIMTGTDDPLVPVLNARILHRAIPHSELIVVDGGGHLMILDSAEELAPVVVKFLSSP